MSSRIPNILNHRPTLIQLSFLAFLVFACMIIFSFAGILLVKAVYGFKILELMTAAENGDSLAGDMRKINALKLVQLVSSVGSFLLPAIIFAGLKSDPLYYLRANKSTSWVMYGLGILILFASIPFINLTHEFNSSIKFNGPLYDLLRGMTDSNEKASLLLLTMNNYGDLLYNLLIVAIIPALGEEFLFRGCMQQVILERSRKPHLAIWVSAFVFSAVHFEFFGFIPRFMLGALLGYLFYYTGSIWVSVIAHAINNGMQVLLLFLFKQGAINFDITTEESLPIYYTLASLPILAGFFYLLYKKRPAEETIFIPPPITNEQPPNS